MNKNDDLLNFLVEGLIAPQRDLVTRAFYKFAEGDPDSAPVNEAILLTACARRVSQAPKELREAIADFRKLLAEGREMEARIRERVELSNFGVVAEFKDETRRASNIFQEVASLSDGIIDQAKKIEEKLKPVTTHLERIGDDLYALKDDLKENRESSRRMVEEAEKMQRLHLENQAFMRSQGKEARANWITTGFLAGILMAAVSFHLPWWEGLTLLAGAIGIIQWLSRQSWTFVQRFWKKGTPT
jgi:hypothetical protein